MIAQHGRGHGIGRIGQVLDIGGGKEAKFALEVAPGPAPLIEVGIADAVDALALAQAQPATAIFPDVLGLEIPARHGRQGTLRIRANLVRRREINGQRVDR